MNETKSLNRKNSASKKWCSFGVAAASFCFATGLGVCAGDFVARDTLGSAFSRTKLVLFTNQYFRLHIPTNWIVSKEDDHFSGDPSFRIGDSATSLVFSITVHSPSNYPKYGTSPILFRSWENSRGVKVEDWLNNDGMILLRFLQMTNRLVEISLGHHAVGRSLFLAPKDAILAEAVIQTLEVP
jgi:hypothetical protein